ncbi:hypothetical protein Trydic_g14448, partial [Trypoxylus dichotomus]
MDELFGATDVFEIGISLYGFVGEDVRSSRLSMKAILNR